MKLMRIRAVRTCPTGAGDRGLIFCRNARPDQRAHKAFAQRFAERSKPGLSDNAIHVGSPGAEITRVFVGEDLFQNRAKFLAQMGGNSPNGQFGHTIVVEVGIRIVAGKLVCTPQ